MYLVAKKWLNGHWTYTHIKPVWKSFYVWRISLVESVRVDGKPRQHVVEYLGTAGGLWHHGKRVTWESLTARLDALANRISPEERGRLEAAFAKIYPRPAPK